MPFAVLLGALSPEDEPAPFDPEPALRPSVVEFAPLVDMIVGAFHAAGCEPTSSNPYTRLADTLAAIGADGTSYTVMYAARAEQIRNRRVAFLPFEPPGLGLMTHLVVSRSRPTPHFSLLMQACDAAMPDEAAVPGDRES